MPTRHAKRLSMDSLTLSDEAVEEFVEFLENKLAPEDFTSLKEMLAKSQQSDEDETETAKDEPPPFKGQPKTGGTMLAGDARGQSYADRFPDAARIKVWL
jgi:hypothetical protein